MEPTNTSTQINPALLLERELFKSVIATTNDPYAFALLAYPWGQSGTDLEGESLRDWQVDTLKDMRDYLMKPDAREIPLGVAVSSGHGIGKSALIGIISDWGMSTCLDCRVVITANTEGQLKTKTAPEVNKWMQMSITADWFKRGVMTIVSSDKRYEKSWRLDFIPWSAKNPSAFQGLHNRKKRIIFIMDEGSGIDDIIWETAEGALTDADTEIIWIVFGNPMNSLGRFRECWRRHSATFQIKRKIDSRTVPGTNLKLFERWAKVYGEDSDFFKSRVKGQFPSQSAGQFMSDKMIEAARARPLRKEQYNFAPVILSCDPAWTGDDMLVISKRQGLFFEILNKIPYNDDDVHIANILARYESKYNAAQVFIDGGFGTGIYSAGKSMGRVWRLVWFSAKSGRVDCMNKRAEMFVLAKEWLIDGGAIPDDDDLVEEMLAVETMATLDGKFRFAPKDAMKALIGRSPNCWDSLGLTFAYPVLMKDPVHTKQEVLHEYDPYDRD